jgi:hypothetical protein
MRFGVTGAIVALGVTKTLGCAAVSGYADLQLADGDRTSSVAVDASIEVADSDRGWPEDTHSDASADADTDADTVDGDASSDSNAMDTNATVDALADADSGCGCPTGVPCVAGRCAPLQSCAQLKERFPTLASGGYTLDLDGDGPLAPQRAFCEQSANGGGWTLALKIDGEQSTFAYDSPLWTNTALLAPTSADPSRTEAKLLPYLATNFTQIRLVFEEGSSVRSLVIASSGSSLRAVFSGPSVSTTTGRASWLTLLSSAQLQANCNQEGFNLSFPNWAESQNVKVRLGIVGNEQADCESPDSWIGIGGFVGAATPCFAPVPRLTAGNVSPGPGTCNGPAQRLAPVFAHVFVR